MKQVLIILESPLFRDYIRLKLEENGVDVTIALSPFEGAAKMRSIVPDLIIMDYLPDRPPFMELLKNKKADPNTVNTPVILFAQEIEQQQLLELVQYNVKKVFTKPVKIDMLFAFFSEVLGIPFLLDDSPGIVEVHVNETIIFIEIAQGLNSDKLDLLRFKISELINLYEIRIPKVIIMLSDIKLSLSDSPNMQKLMRTVLDSSKTRPSYVRVLTNDEFARRYIHGQKEYSGIIVASSLDNAVEGLLTDKSGGAGDAGDRAKLIGNIIQQAKTGEDEEEIVFKSDAGAKKNGFENLKDSLQGLKIAVIDDDFVIQEMLKSTFGAANASVSVFSDGKEFLDAVETQEFDLAFLDINMPTIDGFEVLKTLNARDIRLPVIVLSVVSQREAVTRAVQMGVKSYLVKPLKPEDIFMKSIEILKANF